MKQRILSLATCMLLLLPMLVQASRENVPTDTIHPYELEEVRIIASRPLLRQGSKLFSTAGGIQIVTPTMLREFDIQHLSDLTSVIPNLYMPDYGSRLTAPIYMRGIGARSGGQSTAFYVDGVPMINSSINRQLLDLESIEALSGAHSNIYGRNAMAGTIQLTTRSPIDNTGLMVQGRMGTHGIMEGQARLAHAFSHKVGLSLAGYYAQNQGFYKNTFDGKMADAERSFGGNIKLEWRPDNTQHLRLGGMYDRVNQGAFPYAMVKPGTQEILPISLNAPSSYTRTLGEATMSYSKVWDEVRLDWTASYQALRDDMLMDQDYTALDIFTIQQQQHQDAVTMDFIVRNSTPEDYNWTFGVNGIWSQNNMNVPVTLQPDGLRAMIQPGLNRANQNPKMPVQLEIDASQPRVNHNAFIKRNWGQGFYHESNFHNLFDWEGFDVNLGFRMDMERQAMDFDSDFSLSLFAAPKSAPEHKQQYTVTSRLTGHGGYQDFLQFLPKVAFSYRPSRGSYFFVAASKSYKTGGYSEQMMTEILMRQTQKDMMALVMSGGKKHPETQEGDVAMVAFKPEHAYNLEIGSRSLFWQDRIYWSTTLFGSWIRDLQVARFVDTGAGRTIANAGKAQSYGVETSLKARLWRSLTVSMQYGYTQATFQDYVNTQKTPAGGAPLEIDYKGKTVPYVPVHTYSAMLQFDEPIHLPWLQGIYGSIEARGNGPIYWTPENNIKQKAYTTLGARLGVRLPYVSVSLWGRNLTNEQYSSFYFQSMGHDFLQQARPISLGIDLTLRL